MEALLEDITGQKLLQTPKSPHLIFHQQSGAQMAHVRSSIVGATLAVALVAVALETLAILHPPRQVCLLFHISTVTTPHRATSIHV